MSDSDDKKDDATVIGGGPPVAPKLPTGKPPAPAAPPESDATAGPGGPPVIPPKAPPAGAPRPPAPPAAPPADEEAPTVMAGMGGAEASDEDATQIVRPAANRPRFALRHEQPPGHSGTTTLTNDAYLIGRSPSSDLRLFSANASREHARLTLREGAWYLTPCEGKTVVVDGVTVRAETRLKHKMRLQLGEDELLVIDQAAPVERPAAGAASPQPSPAGAGGRWWIIAVVAAVVAVAAAAAWVLSRG